jgi:hypothetical protein
MTKFCDNRWPSEQGDLQRQCNHHGVQQRPK